MMDALFYVTAVMMAAVCVVIATQFLARLIIREYFAEKMRYYKRLMDLTKGELHG